MVTTAPQTLLDARQLLLTYLNVDKGTVRADDLEPAEVGIAGDPNHRGGYHCGSDRVVPGDYSVVESPRDRTGLAKWACALDVGDFSVSVAGKRHDLRSFSIWLVAQCKADTPDTRDIREVIYSPDGTTVKRWDRLGKRTSGDGSHRWHTHISFHRDAIKAGRDQTAVIRRYLTTTGLLEDDMPLTDADKDDIARRAMEAVLGAKLGRSTVTVAQVLQGLNGVIAKESTSPAELATALAALPKPEQLNVDQIAGAVAERVLAALPDSNAGPVSRDDLEAALRSALGSLDGATPQG